MRTRYDVYRVEWANGEVETVRVPTFFGPAEVLKRLAHCEVSMFVPQGRCVFVRYSALGAKQVHGPAWVAGYDGSDWTAAGAA